MTIFINVIKKIAKIFFLLIFFLTFIIFIQSMKNPNQHPSIFGIKGFIVLSGSMEPKIKIDDLVLSKEVSEDNLKVNDVIVFNDNNKIVTHRIIEITEENNIKKYTTKGDANNTKDNNDITYKDILGKKIAVIPKVGLLINLLKNKITLMILLGAIFIIYIYEYNKR